MNKLSFPLLVYVLSLILFSTSINAQVTDKNLLDIVPPSPMAFEMTRFDAQQPDLYTGTANVSIPIYTIDFDGWKLPLSISYNASGITTNQEATEIGLGWALNTTAVISRQIRSVDDLKNFGTRQGYVYETQDYIELLSDYKEIPINERLLIQGDLDNGVIDTEPDLFSYNFFGYSGSFALSNKAETNDTIKVKQYSNNGNKIIFHEIDMSFTVTTPTGFIGEFTIKERSTNLSGSTTPGSNIYAPIDDLHFYTTYDSGELVDFYTLTERGNFRPITSWYLEKIISPSGKEIIFEYNVDNENGENSEYISINCPSFGEINFGAEIANVSFTRIVQEHVYQETIRIPGELEISFGMEERFDLSMNQVRKELFPPFELDPNPEVYHTLPLKRYTSISIEGLQPESSLNKSIQFHQSYFNLKYLYHYNEEYEKYQFLRGRLDGLTIDNKKFQFLYNEGLNGLPKKSTLGVDHQGYYNGKDNNAYLWRYHNGLNDNTLQVDSNYYENNPNKRYFYADENRLPDIDYGIAGSLSEIVYPTGGNTKLTYEPHEFYCSGSYGSKKDREFLPAINSSGSSGNFAAGGLRIKKLETKDSPSAIPLLKEYEYTNFGSSTSSGKLINPKVFIGFTPTDPYMPSSTYFIVQNPGIPGLNTAKGHPIGYERVIEKIIGENEEIKTEYYFDNNQAEILEFTPDRPYNFSVSNSNFKNGNLLTSKASSYNSGTVSESINDYETNLIDDIVGLRYNKMVWSNGLTIRTFFNYTNPFVAHHLSKNTESYYYNNGSFTSDTDYEYDEFSQVKETEIDNSKNQIIKTVTKRLKDYSNTNCVAPSNGGGCMRTYFDDNNRVSDVLETIQYLDNTVVSAKGYKYDIEHGNIVVRAIYEYNKSLGAFTPSSNGFEFSGSYELKVTFDDYDEEGNLLQYTLKNGPTTAYIWGYNNQYPVAKVENATYSSIENLISFGSNFTINNELSTAQEDDLRELPNTLVTTYQYDPLVGVIKVTDPKGINNNYSYDVYDRLIEVKDQNEHLLQNISYNYKEPEKEGGLHIPLSIHDIGVVQPNSSSSKDIKIENNSNYAITISDLIFPTFFSSVWDNKDIYIPPGSSFMLPVTFNSPSYVTGVRQGTLTIVSDDINGNLTTQVKAIGDYETRIAYAPSTCYEVEYSWQTLYIQIKNNGNSPFSILGVSSDDDDVVPSGYLNLEIQPNQTRTFSASVQAPLSGSQNIFDGTAALSITTNADNYLPTIYIKTNCN